MADTLEPAPAGRERSGGLIDRRLAAQVAVTRRYLAAAVAIGVVSTASVVVQAVLLAGIIERTLFHHASLGGLTSRFAGLGAALVVRAACSWLAELAAQRTSVTVASELRRRVLRHSLGLGPVWLAGERAGELTVTATRGVSSLEVYFGRYVPQAVLAGLAPLAIVVWVAFTDWISALLLIGLVGLVPVLMILFGREAERRTLKQWRRLSSLSSRYLELVEGLPTLRAFGAAGRGRREVAEATEGLRVSTMSTLRVAFLSALAMDLLSGLGVGLVAMVLGLRLLHGSVGLSTSLAVLLVSPEVFLPLRRAGAEFHASNEGQAAARRILDVLGEALPAGVAAAASSGGGGGSGLAVAVGGAGAVNGSGGAGWAAGDRGSVLLRGVSVTYPGGRAALDRFDLNVAAGEHVALVGPSGAGKSTVLAVVLGLVGSDASGDIESGSDSLAAPVPAPVVEIGGITLGSVPMADWRRLCTWVPQRPHLFGGTLEDNLRMGDGSCSPDDLAEAVEACGLASFVAQLPDGLGTRIGTGGAGGVGSAGISLSAGERQRVALARAMLRRQASVVLFDEPVAHLDLGTESQLKGSLAPWLATRTVIVAAHRPELVERIDRVVALEAPVGDRLSALALGARA